MNLPINVALSRKESIFPDGSSDLAALTDSISRRSLFEGEDPLTDHPTHPPLTSSLPPSFLELSTSSASPSSLSLSRPPPPFSSLYFPPPPAAPSKSDGPNRATADDEEDRLSFVAADGPAPPFEEQSPANSRAVAETKAALPPDTKGDQTTSKNVAADDGEPPPPYTESSSPLDSFTYLMAAAGGPASLITQVQQGGPPINTLGGT